MLRRHKQGQRHTWAEGLSGRAAERFRNNGQLGAIRRTRPPGPPQRHHVALPLRLGLEQRTRQHVHAPQPDGRRDVGGRRVLASGDGSALGVPGDTPSGPAACSWAASGRTRSPAAEPSGPWRCPRVRPLAGPGGAAPSTVPSPRSPRPGRGSLARCPWRRATPKQGLRVGRPSGASALEAQHPERPEAAPGSPSAPSSGAPLRRPRPRQALPGGPVPGKGHPPWRARYSSIQGWSSGQRR